MDKINDLKFELGGCFGAWEGAEGRLKVLWEGCFLISGLDNRPGGEYI